MNLFSKKALYLIALLSGAYLFGMDQTTQDQCDRQVKEINDLRYKNTRYRDLIKEHGIDKTHKVPALENITIPKLYLTDNTKLDKLYAAQGKVINALESNNTYLRTYCLGQALLRPALLAIEAEAAQLASTARVNHAPVHTVYSFVQPLTAMRSGVQQMPEFISPSQDSVENNNSSHQEDSFVHSLEQMHSGVLEAPQSPSSTNSSSSESDNSPSSSSNESVTIIYEQPQTPAQTRIVMPSPATPALMPVDVAIALATPVATNNNNQINDTPAGFCRMKSHAMPNAGQAVARELSFDLPKTANEVIESPAQTVALGRRPATYVHQLGRRPAIYMQENISPVKADHAVAPEEASILIENVQTAAPVYAIVKAIEAPRIAIAKQGVVKKGLRGNNPKFFEYVG